MSANEVGKCKESTAKDVKSQGLEQIVQGGRFALQLNDSTDVYNMSQLMVCATFGYQ